MHVLFFCIQFADRNEYNHIRTYKIRTCWNFDHFGNSFERPSGKIHFRKMHPPTLTKMTLILIFNVQTPKCCLITSVNSIYMIICLICLGLGIAAIGAFLESSSWLPCMCSLFFWSFLRPMQLYASIRQIIL